MFLEPNVSQYGSHISYNGNDHGFVNTCICICIYTITIKV